MMKISCDCGKCKMHIHQEKDNELIKNMPCEKSFIKATEIFQIISDPSRTKILWLLCQCELCVNNIAFATNMSSPAVSHHLKLLKSLNLVDNRRDGKEIYYKLTETAEAIMIHKVIDDVLNMKCPQNK